VLNAIATEEDRLTGPDGSPTERVKVKFHVTSDGQRAIVKFLGVESEPWDRPHFSGPKVW
jgi:hypothetical protein